MRKNKRKILREFEYQDTDAWMADDNFNSYASDDDMYSDYLEQDYNDYTDSMDFDEYPSQEQDNEYYGNLEGDIQQKKYYIAKNGERIPYPSKVSLNEKRLTRIIMESINDFFDKYLVLEKKKKNEANLRRDQATADSLEMFKIYWKNGHWLYDIFRHESNIDQETGEYKYDILNYMFHVFREEFFHAPMPNHSIIQLEPYILKAALPAGYQTENTVVKILNELRDIVAYIWMKYWVRMKELEKQGVESYKKQASQEIIDPILKKFQEICSPDNQRVNDTINRTNYDTSDSNIARTRLIKQGFMIYKYLHKLYGQDVIDSYQSQEDYLTNNTFENTTDIQWSIDDNVDFNKMHNEYYPYTCEMCFGNKKNTWDEGQYADTQYNGNTPTHDVNKLYVVLMNGWKNIPKEHTDCLFPEIFGNEKNTPYDMYGLSMIFIWVTPEGKISACNTRWNHEATYTGYHSVDQAMNKVELSKVLGLNFNSVFKGNAQYTPREDDRELWFRNEPDIEESIRRRKKKLMERMRIISKKRMR